MIPTADSTMSTSSHFIHKALTGGGIILTVALSMPVSSRGSVRLWWQLAGNACSPNGTSPCISLNKYHNVRALLNILGYSN